MSQLDKGEGSVAQLMDTLSFLSARAVFIVKAGATVVGVIYGFNRLM